MTERYRELGNVISINNGFRPYSLDLSHITKLRIVVVGRLLVVHIAALIRYKLEGLRELKGMTKSELIASCG